MTEITIDKEQPRFPDFSSAKIFIDRNNIKLVDLKYCVTSGRWHHVTLPSSQFVRELLTSGIGFDGSSVGLRSVSSGDMVLIPDLKTGFVEPCWQEKTLSFISNIHEADTKKPLANDPRGIAQRCEAYLRQTGFADESTWGPEFEFHIFDHVSIENSPNTTCYSVESAEARWHAHSGNASAPLSGYHSLPPRDVYIDIRNKMATTLEEIGIPIKYHHHEVGSPGQSELETPMMNMIDAADASMTIKYITKIVANQFGKVVTYLPKPLFGEAGNGMHFHQTLRKNNSTVFFDPEMPGLLSQIALYYIGGLLTHAPSVLAFTNPSTNSYKRLVPGFEAPVNCFYSIGNRSAAIRIPKYVLQKDLMRIEFRPPDATCNPYLALSAMLMAGLDGINRKIDPHASGFGPINENIYLWSPEKLAMIKSLPVSLSGALEALENDHQFLLEGDVFNMELINYWIQVKSMETLELNNRPHPFEFEQYFDC